MIQGDRIYGNAEPHRLKPGEYGRWEEDDQWYGVPPGTDLLAGLEKHSVTEHEDGTISVLPSILVTDGRGGHRWHGFLTQGIWSQCE